MRFLILILLIGSSLAVTGCATKAGTGTAIGAGTGGAIGGIVGGPTGLLIGAVTGGAVGFVAGAALDEQDRRRAAYALEQNRTVEWHNSSTGADYQFVPTSTTYRNGRECRNYRMTADVNGRPDSVTGTACRRPDGSWEAIST